MADLIDRQAAIELVGDLVKGILSDSATISMKMSPDYLFENLYKPIRQMPSAQPEPKSYRMDEVEIQDILQYIDKHLHPIISPEHWNVYSELRDMISGLSIEQQWIPCSERLPENSNIVLITHKYGVSFGWYNGRYWERGASTKHRLIKTVTAWMPLPNAYIEEE